MNDHVRGFAESAKGLARNPLGIIALFIVLVYGFAALVTINAGSFTAEERSVLIYFLAFFPVLVLVVFAWLVSRHSGSLFGPSDFKNEGHFMQLAAVASLSAAAAKGDAPKTALNVKKIIDVVQEWFPVRAETSNGWRNHILWVDDNPENNAYERQAFEAIGLRFTLALSTDEAFQMLSENQYVAIISDMGRREGPREGYVLLDRLREEGNTTPVLIYASSNTIEHKRETREHGGQGTTNNPEELFEMVTREVIKRQTR